MNISNDLIQIQNIVVSNKIEKKNRLLPFRIFFCFLVMNDFHYTHAYAHHFGYCMHSNVARDGMR